MIYTPKIQKAISVATSIHRSQKRKGSAMPYITHPLSVALILAQVKASEDVIVAGILHDTIEDCEPYGTVTKDYIAKLFGEPIPTIVDDLSEKNKELPWKARKLAALQHIPHMSHESLLVKSADVLHNLSELLADIEVNGIKVFEKFNASKADTLERYKKLVVQLTKTWPENPLLSELRAKVEQLVEISDTKNLPDFKISKTVWV